MWGVEASAAVLSEFLWDLLTLVLLTGAGSVVFVLALLKAVLQSYPSCFSCCHRPLGMAQGPQSHMPYAHGL